MKEYWFTGNESTALPQTKNSIFSSLVESNPAILDTSRSVSVLWSNAILCMKISLWKVILSKSGRFSKANTYLFGEVSLDGGSGCGSVGRAVASNSRGPRFESSLWQTFILNIYCQLCIEKTKIKKKRPKMAHLISITGWLVYSLTWFDSTRKYVVLRM